MNTAPQPAAARTVTGWSVAGLVLLVPTVVVAWIAVLATNRGSRCLTYGEQCSTVPGEALYGCFWIALAAGLLALMWPRARWTGARIGVVFLQWVTQLTLGALILSGA
ncbi:hypothetical protein [Streptomyces sp. WELS2]|uniref:hypothetical protein n=1 Tax=Streptomyces sp. WELS2 TaxID=2749435 RepID=UPI0015F0E748|nr:hypothetical protein [Streptomyces sp. WELS2]